VVNLDANLGFIFELYFIIQKAGNLDTKIGCYFELYFVNYNGIGG